MYWLWIRRCGSNLAESKHCVDEDSCDYLAGHVARRFGVCKKDDYSCCGGSEIISVI